MESLQDQELKFTTIISYLNNSMPETTNISFNKGYFTIFKKRSPSSQLNTIKGKIDSNIDILYTEDELNKILVSNEN
ncbi:12134_t:CDS:2 [Entrophospora sp. SA101]|nr:12134_t:CDS:2 [Entrophospora sp. SA101]